MKVQELSSDPSDADLIEALITIRSGGALTTPSATREDIDAGALDWPLAVVRYVNELGPDSSTSGFATAAYNRIAALDA